MNNTSLGEGGSFSVQWLELPEEDSYLIISTGRYGKISRVKTAGFALGSGGGTGEPGGPGEPEYPTWDLNHRYIKGEYVVRSVTIDGVTTERLYLARHNGYVGEEPGQAHTTWQEVTNNFRNSNFYELVNGNTIVYYGSSYWQAKWNGFGVDNVPGTTDMWRELIDEWRPYGIYSAKDVVSYEGNRYRVKWNSPPGPPDSSDPHGPWELLNNSVRTLQRVSVTPSLTTLKIGEQVTLAATAHFSDGTTEDVTNKVVWKTTYPQIASLSGNVATGVMDTGVEGCNSTLISASYTYKHPTRNDIEINRVGICELRVSADSENPGLIIWEKETPP